MITTKHIEYDGMVRHIGGESKGLHTGEEAEFFFELCDPERYADPDAVAKIVAKNCAERVLSTANPLRLDSSVSIVESFVLTEGKIEDGAFVPTRLVEVSATELTAEEDK